jgi:hypothetical protein
MITVGELGGDAAELQPRTSMAVSAIARDFSYATVWGE